jgi:hypothetical protein
MLPGAVIEIAQSPRVPLIVPVNVTVPSKISNRISIDCSRYVNALTQNAENLLQRIYRPRIRCVKCTPKLCGDGEMPKKLFDTMNQRSEAQVQCPEDKQAPGYDNNVNSNPKERWLTGAVQATKMPHYDNGPKWFFGPGLKKGQ